MDYSNVDSLDIVEIVEVILANFSRSLCYRLVTSLLCAYSFKQDYALN